MNPTHAEHDPRIRLRPNTNDRLHDLQLLHDVERINDRTLRAQGSLASGGLPVVPKRKPNIPKRTAPTPVAMAVDEIPNDSEGAEMFIIGKLFKKRVPREPWPLRFDSFSFGARCYYTLRCVVVFMNKDQVPRKCEIEPSGKPYATDWKDRWDASHAVMADEVFPSPVKVRWTAMDGVERTAEVGLESIFPDRLILHNAREEEVKDGWGLERHARRAEILLEVNDRTINVYMRGWVLLKQRRDPDDHKSDSLRDLMLAWTKTY